MRNTPVRPAARRLALPLACLAFIAAAGAARGQEAATGTAPAPVDLDGYRRSVLEARGDSGRGRRLFEDSKRSRCNLCHAIDGRGGKLGPDLEGVGGRYGRDDLLRAILEPSAAIHPDYAATLLATRSGRVIQGIVRPVSDSEIEVATSETETVRLPIAEVEEQKPAEVSLMPAGLQAGLTPAEMADLLAYLGDLALPQALGPHEAVDADEIPHAARPVEFVPIHSRERAFHRPVWFGPLPGQLGTFAVLEHQRGRVWLLDDEAHGGEKGLFADLGGETAPGNITGVLGLAFHPDYARNRRYFLKLHPPREAGKLSIHIVERRASADGRGDSGGPSRPILKIPVVSEIHNGGHLAFGPDGLLYIGMGETGPQGDPLGHGQDLGQWLGKVLRVDVDHPEGDRPYAIPATNPFRDRPGARPEIWAYGFREPWRFSFDGPTGDLWVGDVGQGRYEEVAIVRAGENHGWNVLEGFRPHSERFRSPSADYVPPIFAYSHRVGVSVTGGFVYLGKKQPAMVGKYVFGDYETRRVWAVTQEGRKLTSIVEIGRSPERISSFGADEEGELYVVGFDNGVIYRVDPAGADLAAVSSRELVPTSRRSATSWRYSLRRQPDGWAGADFDDSSWTAAAGGFGGRGMPGVAVRTEWRTADIWLRREFAMPDPVPASLALSAFHDEDAEVFINGALAARLPGYANDYVAAPILEPARAAIRPGRNVLAVHCRQTQGGQFIDVGIVEARPAPAR